MASGGITVETDPVFLASPAASITDAKKEEWDGKQDKISDLDAIRIGASAGATAVQPNEDVYVWNWNGEQEGILTTEEFDAMYNAKLVILGLFNAPLMKAMGDENNLSLVMSMASGDSVEYLAFMLSREDQTFAVLEQSSFPIGVTEEMISDFGFTKNTGDYSKPQNGIPKSDLASSVQTSLGKADTALQSYTEQYRGTVTGVKVNGSTKNPSNGVVDLGTVLTAHQDISGKQDKLVSGTNIKTINGQSILGSGNITIGGGSSGSSSGGSGAYGLVNHGTSDTEFALTPNTLHVWDEVASLTLTLGSEQSGVANEYLFQFTSGSTATTLSLPDTIKWQEDLTIEANKTYQVSILNGFATVLSFNN